MSQLSTSYRLSADASMSTIQTEFLTNLYRLEALSHLAQAALNEESENAELVIGVAVLFQDVIDVFQEIKRHLERVFK